MPGVFVAGLIGVTEFPFSLAVDLVVALHTVVGTPTTGGPGSVPGFTRPRAEWGTFSSSRVRACVRAGGSNETAWLSQIKR